MNPHNIHVTPPKTLDTDIAANMGTQTNVQMNLNDSDASVSDPTNRFHEDSSQVYPKLQIINFHTLYQQLLKILI